MIKMLFVEDDEEIQTVIKLCMTSYDYEIWPARNGKEALERLQSVALT